MGPHKLKGIRAEDFAHPLEVQALDRLKNTRGLGKVVSKFYELGFEKTMKLQVKGSCLKAEGNSFTHLTFLVEKACEVLECPLRPVVYLQRTEELLTRTMGTEDPIMIISTEAVDKLSHQELLFMIGREIAHLRSNHILYQEIGLIFPDIIEALSAVTLGIGSIVSTGLRYALFNWSHMADYTADRGGLLTCQDTNAALMVHSKWAGLPERYWQNYNISPFVEQASSMEALDPRTFDKIVGFILGDHNWSVFRASELLKWIDSGEYTDLLGQKLLDN